MFSLILLTWNYFKQRGHMNNRIRHLILVGSFLFALVTIMTSCAPDGGYSTTYEVALDYAYRSYDAVFPRVRETYLDDEGKFAVIFDELRPQWTDGNLVTNTLARFHVEYPEDSFSEEQILQALKDAVIERVPSTKIVSVTVNSDSRRLSEQLAGTFARALADYTCELTANKAEASLIKVRDNLRIKENALMAMRDKVNAFKGESGKLVQSAEFIKMKREQSEKTYPEYQKAFEEAGSLERIAKLDRIVACVLGQVPAAASVGAVALTNRNHVQEWPVASPQWLLVEAEKHSLAEAERQRKDWNDRSQDRLEQIRLRAECPRRKYLLPYPSKYGDGTEEYCSRNPSINTNSSLFGFLGCRFGEQTTHPEQYIRLKQPFGIFPWIRYDTCRSCQKIARCDARLTFRTQGLSDVPFRQMKRIQAMFQDKYGLRFIEERRGENYFSEASGEDGYRVGLFVTNALVHVKGVPNTEYTMGFEVVNELVLPIRVRRTQETHFCNWHDILHITNISRTKRKEESAWKYLVVRGKSTEELLDEFIKTGDRSVLRVGKTEIGTPVGWNGGGTATGYFARQGGTGNSGYHCMEWEADLIMPFSGAFVKICDAETQARISAKLYTPAMFQPREKGKTGSFTVGRIYCDLIPGDRVTWDKEDCRKTGTVCEDGETGEYWDSIKKSMKDVETIERAREEDWAPTALTRECDKKKYDVNRKTHQLRHGIYRWTRDNKGRTLLPLDFSSTNLIATTNFLADCLANRRPGLYRGPHMEHILDLSYPTRDFARKKVLHRENWSLDDYQYAMYEARRELLDAYFPEDLFGNGVPIKDAQVFSLSRFERERLHWGRKWWEILSFPRYNHDGAVVLKHHVFNENPHAFSSEEAAAARSELEVCQDRLIDFSTEDENGRRKTEAEHIVHNVYEVLYSAFSSEDGFRAVSDLVPLCRRIIAANLHKAPVKHILRRLVVEFKDNPESWRFAKDTMDELKKIEQMSFANGRKKAGEDMEAWLSKSRDYLTGSDKH